MRRTFLFTAALLTAGAAACGGNSESTCRDICDWWHTYCFSEDVESCVSDCTDADESADDVYSRCVEGAGWPEPSSCVSASCCVGFVYWPEQYDLHCL